jgi:hypothetical protein
LLLHDVWNINSKKLWAMEKKSFWKWKLIFKPFCGYCRWGKMKSLALLLGLGERKNLNELRATLIDFVMFRVGAHGASGKMEIIPR